MQPISPVTFFVLAALVLIVLFSVATLRAVSRSNALVASAMTEFASAMKELHRQLNSRLDALVDLTGVYQRSLGVAEGRQQQRALDEKGR